MNLLWERVSVSISLSVCLPPPLAWLGWLWTQRLLTSGVLRLKPSYMTRMFLKTKTEFQDLILCSILYVPVLICMPVYMLYVWFYTFRHIDAHVRHRHSTYVDHEIDPPPPDSKAQRERKLLRSYGCQPLSCLPMPSLCWLTGACLRDSWWWVLPESPLWNTFLFMSAKWRAWI